MPDSPHPASPLDIDAARRRCEAATKGPWAAMDGDYEGFAGSWDVVAEADWCAIASVAGTAQAAKLPRDKEANADFIAAARTDLPLALDAIEHLAAENARLMRVLERDRSNFTHGLNAIRHEIDTRRGLTQSRGSYEWDDDRYREEFGNALDAIERAVKAAEEASHAHDLTDCPRGLGSDAEVRLARTPFAEANRPPVDGVAAENARLRAVLDGIRKAFDEPDVDYDEDDMGARLGLNITDYREWQIKAVLACPYAKANVQGDRADWVWHVARNMLDDRNKLVERVAAVLTALNATAGENADASQKGASQR